MPHKKSGPLLLIEDDLGIREALAMALKTEGYTVFPVKNGQEGIDYLYQNTLPHLIILDLKMPIKDGEEFITEASGHPLFKNIPIFIMSANLDQFSNRPGVRAKFQKPIDLGKLLDAISDIFSKP